MGSCLNPLVRAFDSPAGGADPQPPDPELRPVVRATLNTLPQSWMSSILQVDGPDADSVWDEYQWDAIPN